MKTIYTLVLSTLVLCIGSCKKQLEQAVSSTISGIDSLVDCERLLNDYILFGEQPIPTELSADNYYVRDKSWSLLSTREKNIYRWAADLLEGGSFRDYDVPYRQQYVSNEILKALRSIPYDSALRQRRSLVEGSAYFFRALASYNLLQLFARPYNRSTAETDTGIVIRLIPERTDFSRSTMQESYDQVIGDLLKAVELLPLLPDPGNRHIASKTAGRALLARVYLSMRDYDKAASYADTCLQQYRPLLNYNECNSAQPFQATNPEVIFQAFLNANNTKILVGRGWPNAIVDSAFYQSYRSNDLRQKFFYKLSEGKPLLNFSYTGNAQCFAGIATDEVYLILAECRARQGRFEEALKVLNPLLLCRYRPTGGQPIQLDSFDQVLDTILAERRKELAFRGLRWTDLRRFNKERPGRPIVRNVDGRFYYLFPNDLRYTFPIPEDAIRGSGIVQNPR
jgi:tetratricopeptide (TPR) repeat protein